MNSPRLRKGALGVVDSKRPQVANVIRFQYNLGQSLGDDSAPTTSTRTQRC